MFQAQVTLYGTIKVNTNNNASIREAVEVANFAAGIVVAKLGTATVKKKN